MILFTSALAILASAGILALDSKADADESTPSVEPWDIETILNHYTKES